MRVSDSCTCLVQVCSVLGGSFEEGSKFVLVAGRRVVVNPNACFVR